MTKERDRIIELARPSHRREGLENPTAVRFVGQTAVADHQHAAIGFGTNQPPRALLQADRGLRQLIVEKRITACARNMVQPRGEQRIVRGRERQLVDDDQRQGVALDVDALPEALAAEQNGVAEKGRK